MTVVAQEKLNIAGVASIRPFQERVDQEEADRLEAQKNKLSFGIGFFDDAFDGIVKEDFIVIGASSGLGKTELATQIAMKNAGDGKRVYYFALEAEKYEIERRIKYRALGNAYYTILKDKIPGVNMDYIEWYAGRIDPRLKPYEAELHQNLKEQYKTLNTYYRESGSYTVEIFEQQIMAAKDYADLIVVDHLHYFDWEETDDNRAIKRIVKTMRDVVQHVKIPVVLVAHLRKRDRKYKQLAPELEDFHGSSDIGKIATKAITIAPAFIESGSTTKFSTYLRAAKNRYASNRTRLTALTNFDITRNEYDRQYFLGSEGKDGEYVPISKWNAIPAWAKNAKIYESKEKKTVGGMFGEKD